MTVYLGFAAAVGAGAVNEGAGGANLNAGAAGDACAFAQGSAQIGDEEAFGAAFFKAEGEVADEFTAGAHAAAAEDAAVVIEDEVRMGGIHRIGRPGRLDGPVGHFLPVGCVLQFAVASRHLAEGAEMVALAEDHGEDELAG